MKILLILILFLILLIFQLTLMPRLTIFGVFPNIILAIILVLAVKYRGSSIFFAAIFCGLAFDFFSSLPFGIWIINFVITVWLLEFFGKIFFKSADFFGQTCLIAGACIFFSFFQLFLIKVFAWFGLGIDLSFWQVILRVGLPEFLLNFAVSLLFLLLGKKFHGLFARF